MKINLIGDCDKRAVLYTLMKITQTLGDVLIVSDDNRLVKLSDTGENGGHYQNVMICITDEGIDDFFSEFGYTETDFEHIIIDNIVCADADIYLFVEGMETTQRTKDILEYMDGYLTINPYKRKMFAADTIYRLEQFESLRDMCPINKTIAQEVSKLIAKPINISPEYLFKIAMIYQTAAQQTRPANKSKQTGVSRVTSALKKKEG